MGILGKFFLLLSTILIQLIWIFVFVISYVYICSLSSNKQLNQVVLKKHGLIKLTLYKISTPFKCSIAEPYTIKFKGKLFDNTEINGYICQGILTIPTIKFN